MKNVFLIKMSEDGNCSEVFTNIKALYNGISDTGYKCQAISVWNDELNRTQSFKFNYGNLVAAIRMSQGRNRFTMCDILCEGNSYLEIQELSIRTK